MPTPKRQLELFDTDRFVQDFVAHIDGRLPHGDWIKIPDVAEAFNVCNNQVLAWLDEGAMRGFNKGARSRRRVVVFRASILDFARRRAE